MFNEIIFKHNQTPNDEMYIKLSGKLLPDFSYYIERKGSSTNTLAYVISGCIMIDYNNKTYVANSGTTFVIPSGIEYSIYSDKLDLPSMVWLNISGTMFNDLFMAIFKTKGIYTSNDNNYENIINISKSSDNSFICKKITNILFDIHFNQIKNSSINHTNTSQMYDRYICDRLFKEFSVEEMANFFSISTITLNRHFNKLFNCSPFKYYNEKRLDISLSLLKNTDYTIEYIAAQLNYIDRNYFSYVFKNKYGISPAKYRKQHNN